MARVATLLVVSGEFCAIQLCTRTWGIQPYLLLCHSQPQPQSHPFPLSSPNLDLSVPHVGLKHVRHLPLGLGQPNELGQGVIKPQHLKAGEITGNSLVCPFHVQIRKFESRKRANGLLMGKVPLEVIAELEWEPMILWNKSCSGYLIKIFAFTIFARWLLVSLKLYVTCTNTPIQNSALEMFRGEQQFYSICANFCFYRLPVAGQAATVWARSGAEAATWYKRV